MKNRELAQLMLNTGANLLGFCLIVITALHIADAAERLFVDEVTMIVALLVTLSCVLSFIVLRHEDSPASKRLSAIASYCFMASLFGILVSIVLIVFNYL